MRPPRKAGGNPRRVGRRRRGRNASMRPPRKAGGNEGGQTLVDTALLRFNEAPAKSGGEYRERERERRATKWLQ